MLFSLIPTPFPPICTGVQGFFRTFGTTGNNTTHTTARGA